MGVKRGICYVAWGERHLREACESSKSARRLGYRTCLITDDLRDWSLHFDQRRIVDFSALDDLHPLFRKYACLNATPFDTTCFLDADTLVHEQIDLGFTLAEKHGLAIALSGGGLLRHGGEEFVHYNTGVLFFSGYQPDLFGAIISVGRTVHGTRHVGDEAPFSVALRKLATNPVVLPPAFNCARAGKLRTRSIKVLHSRWSDATHFVGDDFGEDAATHSPFVVPQTRGIVYVAWGAKWIHEAIRSAKSARDAGYKTALLTDDSRDWTAQFDIQKPVDFSELSGFESFQMKWLALLHSPFDVTCFLDSDTTVNGNLDLGFRLAEQGHFCVTLSPAMVFHYEDREWIHYNGGTFYFRGKQPKLFEWFCESAVKLRGSGLLTDEPPMSLAFQERGISPMVLPAMFNYIRVGKIHTRPIKVFHSRFHPATEIVSDHFGNDFVQ